MIYANYWDEFYRRTYTEKESKALWDVDPALSAGKDLERILKWINPKIPLLDVGCGTGGPTAYLAQHLRLVIGGDTSVHAVDLAQKIHKKQNLIFKNLDLSDEKGCNDIYREFGAVNLYMRGVLHQIKPEHKQQVVNNIAHLLQQTGTFYFIEVASNIKTYFREVSPEFHLLPKAVQAVFISNLPPEGVSLEDIPLLFPPEKFIVLDKGEDRLMTNLILPNGQKITIPAVYGVIKVL